MAVGENATARGIDSPIQHGMLGHMAHETYKFAFNAQLSSTHDYALINGSLKEGCEQMLAWSRENPALCDGATQLKKVAALPHNDKMNVISQLAGAFTLSSSMLVPACMHVCLRTYM